MSEGTDTSTFTQWFSRKVRFGWPVFWAVMIYIVGPQLAIMVSAYDVIDERLTKGEMLSAYKLYRPLFMLIVGSLGAAGALRSKALDERQQKLAKWETEQRSRTELEWTQEQTKQPPKG